MERAFERRMLTVLHRTPLRVSMDDDLAQRLLRGGRCLDSGANLTEIPQLTKERGLSGRSFLLKFVRVYTEDTECLYRSSWRFIRINVGINTYYFDN